jgi:hypothetical protein
MGFAWAIDSDAFCSFGESGYLSAVLGRAKKRLDCFGNDLEG